MFAFYQFLPHNTFFFIIHHNPAEIHTTKYGIIKSTQLHFHDQVLLVKKCIKRGSSILSTTVSLYYNILKPKKAKKTKLFHEICKFHSHTVPSRLPPQLRRRLFPCQPLKELPPDDPLHPCRDRNHPAFHLHSCFFGSCPAVCQ